MTTFVFTTNPASLNWDKWLIFFCLLPPLLPLAFYFYSLPHSSTLFPSTPLFFSHCWKHPSTKQCDSEPNIKNMLPLHSVLSVHVNEGKTFTEQSVLRVSLHPSDFFLPYNSFSKLASFAFYPLSFQFKNTKINRLQKSGTEWKDERDRVGLTKKRRVGKLESNKEEGKDKGRDWWWNPKKQQSLHILGERKEGFKQVKQKKQSDKHRA